MVMVVVVLCFSLYGWRLVLLLGVVFSFRALMFPNEAEGSGEKAFLFACAKA